MIKGVEGQSIPQELQRIPLSGISVNITKVEAVVLNWTLTREVWLQAKMLLGVNYIAKQQFPTLQEISCTFLPTVHLLLIQT